MADNPTNGRRGTERSKSRGQARGAGNRGRGRSGFGSSHPSGKKRDMGRNEWSRNPVDKRKRNDSEQVAKRQKVENGEEDSAHPFSREEIEGEARKPKRKVAVMIGYAGSGYKGMQINGKEKTIEGDIFKAFVAAGAISKANADDPKKSSLVRCARTDKGVHAAGNVISLKLIVEESDVVQKINENLPSQIRVWGIERTNGSFSCYQTCDSRWYEYLIPTYSFLPPQPESYLGKKLDESAVKEGKLEAYQTNQLDAAAFWKDAEETYVKPILDSLEPEIAEAVMAGIYNAEDSGSASSKGKKVTNTGSDGQDQAATLEPPNSTATETSKREGSDSTSLETEQTTVETNQDQDPAMSNEAGNSKSVLTPVEAATKRVKAAFITAKKAYRISEFRRNRVQEALDCYVGTCNFHNYTIQKSFSDPSAKRVIRSFKVGPKPIVINDTEWLSLKVHGQSFMMHQIRKMVAMVALVIRCGASKDIIKESYGPANISIPKAPGLGLLLERPVFETYNEKATSEYNKEKIDFDRYQTEMDEFKQREIYDRIFRVENQDHQFHTFFHHLDHFRTDFFLWVTASGIKAASQSNAVSRRDDVSDDEEVNVNGQEG